MKIIIISKFILLFLIVNIAIAGENSTKADPQDITTEQARRFIEDQLDGGWGEAFHLQLQPQLSAAERQEEERLVRQSAWLLREVLIFKKRQPGRLSRTDYDCYSLKINGSLTPQKLYNLLSALRETISVVGVGNITLGNDEFDPGIICPADRQLFADGDEFRQYLREHY